MKYYNETFVHNSPFPLSVKHLKDFDFVAHWHTEVEIILVLEGIIRVGVNSNQELIREGEMVICGSGDIHYFDSRGLSSSIASLIFSAELLESKAGWPKNGHFKSSFLTTERLTAIALENLASVFQMIVTEENEKKPAYEMLLKGKLLELCGLVLRHVPVLPVNRQLPSPHTSKTRRLKEILSYVEENFPQDLSLESLSAKFGMSPFYLSKIFHSITGMNFRRYINFIRVSEADYLLTNSSKAITDIAFECGFNSIRTFNRAFKDIKGYTPSELR